MSYFIKTLNNVSATGGTSATSATNFSVSGTLTCPNITTTGALSLLSGTYTSIGTTTYLSISTAGFSRMFITQTGSVGVATQNPISTLDAAGSFHANSYIDTLQSTDWATSTTFNFNTGTTWYFTGTISATKTAVINFSNLTATSGQSYTFTFIIPNNATAYYLNPTSVQCAGTTATLKSNLGTVAAASASGYIVQTFTCFYMGTNWYVLTSATSF